MATLFTYCLGECNTDIQLERRELNQYSSLALAFLGDAVYEQLVRLRLVLDANRPVGELHRLKTQKVCAGFQAKAVNVIMPMLTDEEQTVLKRGRNATGTTVPKHSSAAEYRHATGVEALFGYLYLKGDTKRIDEIFKLIWDMKVD